MAAPALQFHLLLEELMSRAGPRPPSAPTSVLPAGLTALEVPCGVWQLSMPAGQRPFLSAPAPVVPDQACVLEAVYSPQRPQLVLISPAERRPRINGQHGPRFVVLGVKDQIQLGDDHVLHVTLFNRPSVGAPAPQAIGSECPICRVPFTADTTVYTCSSCGTPLHCEGEGKLECVLVGSECPICNAPVVMKEGYVYLPELGNG